MPMQRCWNEFLVRKEGIATAPNFIEEDRRLWALYSEGKLNMEDYLAFAMHPLADMPTEQVSALVEECVGESSIFYLSSSNSRNHW